ncbi:unnamed protein product [Spirodela intermedia]|uniref:Uncharacterized protein n=1 Tax=Spirodela intermedia TaxID=51605 RepID=A0A7I8KN88_SPIIN|nr:unnamed protein product [Spirodela intermedia]
METEEADVSLLRAFEQIYQEYEELVSEVHTVRSNCNSEVRRREALEITCSSLKQENERLRKLNMETLANFAHQFECHMKYQSMKEELVDANRKALDMKIEHERQVEKLEQDHRMKIADLENQVSCLVLQQSESEANITQLQQDLAHHKSSAADRESQCQREIQELRDWIVVEQQEKNELMKKLQDAETELMMTRSKQAEQQRESISIRHVETLKQKIMKLRRENEALKRRLSGSIGSDLQHL